MTPSHRLVRITHIRCADYEATTYIMAPSYWTDKVIGQKIQQAQNAYMAQIQEAKNEDPPPPYSWSNNFRDYPDLKVSEVMEIHEKAKAERSAWDVRHREACRGFELHLKDVGFQPLREAVDMDDAFEVDWAHNHGTRIDYGETDIDTLPNPVKLAGKATEDDEEF